jgi:hypothetical protein
MVNAKKLKVKKPKLFKSPEERAKIVQETIEKLEEVHFIGTNENGDVYSGFDAVEEFLKVLKEYAKPNLLSGFSGRILVPEFNRYIEYVLPIRQGNDHIVKLVAAS